MNVYALLGVWLVFWVAGWWMAKKQWKAKQPIGVGWLISLPLLGLWMYGMSFVNNSSLNMVDEVVSSPEIELTDIQRNRLSTAVGANYNYTGNTDKLDQSIKTLNNISDPTTAQMNQFIVDEYQKSRFELEKLARQGDYQAQRNLAFGHATDPKIAGADPSEGCAWYLVLYNSESPQIVDDLDRANIDIYCSAKALNEKQQRAAEIKANLLLKAIYNKNTVIKINDHLNNYL